MKKTDLIKGFLIKPIMEFLKKEYGIKSPSPSNLYVTEVEGGFKIEYKSSKANVDFSDSSNVQKLLNEIKSKPQYDKVWL
jgi:hypothetical protein